MRLRVLLQGHQGIRKWNEGKSKRKKYDSGRKRQIITKKRWQQKKGKSHQRIMTTKIKEKTWQREKKANRNEKKWQRKKNDKSQRKNTTK